MIVLQVRKLEAEIKTAVATEEYLEAANLKKQLQQLQQGPLAANNTTTTTTATSAVAQVAGEYWGCRVLGSIGGYWGALESVREYLRELVSVEEHWRVLESTNLLSSLSGGRTNSSASAPIIGM